MRRDKKDLAKGNMVKRRMCGFAAVIAAVAVVVLCSVWITRAKDDNKTTDDRFDHDTSTENIENPETRQNRIDSTEKVTEPETQQNPTNPTEKLTDAYKLLSDEFYIVGENKESKLYFREDIGELSLWNHHEELVWKSDSHQPVALNHPGQRAYYVVTAADSSYLMEYTPYAGQGVGTPHYEIFSIDEHGNEKIFDEGEIGFLLFKKSDGQSCFPIDDILGFYEKVKGYMENGKLLISTVQWSYDYAGPDRDNHFRYLEYIYPWIYETVGLENLDLNQYDSLEQVLIDVEKGLPVRAEEWDMNFENMEKEIMSTKETTK